ncbi:hypothetical protein B0A52_04237 [Exophiala mesophila]|uniref:Uncharacterized protein n=1 Tax=Exophiala mesophila TaxID=212818 RepID=A0A438N7T9_EXOME|nr:hypothetical protein B0A52_04237 [Exophiala mesophila]
MFVQLILLAIFGIVLSTPILPSARSDQSKTYPLTFNIDPDVSGPACGRHLLANINIKRLATDPASTSGVCNDIRDYLTHPDGKGNTDVDLIFTCPGQPETEDHGSRPVKVFLNTDANVDTTKDNVDADLTVTNDAEGIRFKTVVSLGIKKTGNSELLWQLIYCY